MASSISEGRRLRSFIAAVFAAVTVAAGAMPGARAEPAAGSNATREAARAKLVEGVEAMKRGDYRASLARFEEAYALVPSPKIHYDFGLAYLGLGRSADALAAFERFLAEAPDAPADKRERAAALVSRLRARAAEPSARGDPAAAAARPTPAGPQTASSERRPDAIAAPAPAALVAQGDEPSTTAPATDRDPMRARRITALSWGAAGVSLAAVGLVFGLLARGEGESLTRDSQMGTLTPTRFDPDKESRGILYERLEIIGLVAGAAAAAAGAVLYATSRRAVVLEPVAGPSLAGANLRLAF
jgi:tetratricopeptide (TPR) repeat protein